MSIQYNDTTAVMQIIGCVFNNPQLLEMTEKYTITKEDFPNKFHRTVFGVMYSLHGLGTNIFTLENIADFLQTKPKSQAIYNKDKGEEYLIRVSESAQLESFDYYYNRLKKMTLLRAFDNIGVDVTDIYDPDNITDIKKREQQSEYLDNSSLAHLATLVQDKVNALCDKYVQGDVAEAQHAGTNILTLIRHLKEEPEVGIPMYGDMNNTVMRGARLGAVYLRSALTGVGKTRALVADICSFGCDEIYDPEQGKWIPNGTKEPSEFIATEQDISEIQTLMLAFLSNVSEDKIIDGTYSQEEEQRIEYAANLIINSPIYIEELPEFSLSDLERVFKRDIRKRGIKYVAFDYIQAKVEVFNELTRLAGGTGFREDQVVLLMMTKLKDIAKKYGVFIYTASQLNGDAKDAKILDQNVLRGGKSMADKADIGCAMGRVRPDDLTALESILATEVFKEPNIKNFIYKNRRSKYSEIILWCHATLGTCRITPMFATDYQYRLVPVENTKIFVESAFEEER